MTVIEAGELMTTAEVAEALRRPQGTLRQWRHYGKGPGGWFYVEGLVMYPRREVERFLSAARATGRAARP